MAIDTEVLRNIVGCEGDEFTISDRLTDRIIRNEAYGQIVTNEVRSFLMGVLTAQEVRLYEPQQALFRHTLRAVVGPHTMLRQGISRRGHGFQVRAMITEYDPNVSPDLLTCNDFVIDMMRSSIAYKRSEVTKLRSEKGKTVWKTTSRDVPKVLQPPVFERRWHIHTGVEYEREIPDLKTDDSLKATHAQAFVDYARQLRLGEQQDNTDFIFIPH